MEGRFRSRYGRVAVARAALVVFLLFCALIAGIVFTLDLSARRSNSQQAATELAGTARVAASTFSTMHANLRARVGELAASNSLQQALLSAYRRRLLFAAAITLALAAGLATRLARPVARIFADLAHLTLAAETDSLTNIANRRALDQRLDEEVDHARRLGTNVAFVIADIDNFKSVNDRFGHQAGDEVLRRVAAVFTDAVRELDLPGRYGGEEIAVVGPGTNLTGARGLAEKIRARIEELELTTPDGDPLKVTASFGAACFPAQTSVEELVAAADAALYEAKRTGKNRVVTATAKRKSRSQTAAADAP